MSGINAKRENRIKGIVDRISSEDDFDSIKWITQAPVQNFCRSAVDEIAQKNAELHNDMGLEAKIVRQTVGENCKWCDALAGEYIYPDVPKEVYQRHDDCDCIVEYMPGDGRVQNVWSKQWTEAPEDLKIRKQHNLLLNNGMSREELIASNVVDVSKAREVAKGKDITTIEELNKLSNSSIINMKSYSDIVDFFKSNYDIEIEGFNNKVLDDLIALFAGLDDILSISNEAGALIKKVIYVPQLRVFAKLSSDGILRIGKDGLGSYSTGIHEAVHAINFAKSDYDTDSFADNIIAMALKELKIRRNSNVFKNLAYDITLDARDAKKSTELLSYAIETELAGGIGNDLSNTILNLLLRSIKDV